MAKLPKLDKADLKLIKETDLKTWWDQKQAKKQATKVKQIGPYAFLVTRKVKKRPK